MFLIAMENDPDYKDSVQWCIKEFLTGYEIWLQYGIRRDQLPLSSRENPTFQRGLRTRPMNVPMSVIERTNFKKLPAKNSKRRCCQLLNCSCKTFVRSQNPSFHGCEDCGHSAAEHGCEAKDILLPRTRIYGRGGQQRMKEFMRRSWNDYPAVPVVVIKGKQTWIEWKKFVQVDVDASVAISLSCYKKSTQRYNAKSWKIECLDYDSGRIYYQHRLVGRVDTRSEFSYEELAPLVTTTLEFVR